MSQRDPQQLKSVVAGVFDRAAGTYDSVAGSYFSIFAPRLVDKIDVREGAVVIDVACGKGAVAIPCARRVGASGTVVGVDISSEMTRHARAGARGLDLTNFAVGVMDAERLALRDGCADALTCAFSLHFLPAPSDAAMEFSRVLRRGGSVVVSEWGEEDHRWSWESDLIGTLPARSVSSGSFDTPQALGRFLEAGRFTDIEVGTESVTVNLADEEEWWAWKWSYSFRYVLEQLDAETRNRFKAEAQERVRGMRQADGIPLELHALMATARRS